MKANKALQRTGGRRGRPCSPQDGVLAGAELASCLPLSQIGHRYVHSSRHVRVLHYGHFRIAYLLKADGDVDILGVFHGALDITKYQL